MTPARTRVVTRIAGLVLLAGWALLVYPHARVALIYGRPWSWLAAALGTALALSVVGPLRRVLCAAIERPPRWAFLGVSAAICAGISAATLLLVLDGKPMSRDAAVYLMEARALASGTLGIEVPAPALGASAHFLLAGPDGRVFGVFPPGWPAALVPFVLVGLPYAAGPVVAALLVPLQHAITRVLGGSELAARGAVILTFASAARAFETADLLSHAFVAVTGCAALVLVGDPERPVGSTRALGAGALTGWATCARLLDGVVLGAGVAVVLVLRIVAARCESRVAHCRPSTTTLADARVCSGQTVSGAKARHLAIFVLGGLPFACLLFLHQNAATGDWARPTQLDYFARSDWPPTCHRLGFGKDIGCRVEHPEVAAMFGADGYDVGDALLVTTDRAGRLGDDLFLCAPLLLLALLAPVVRPTRGTLGGALLATAFTLAYGLFYYGNAPVFGARHLFPVAPIVWALAAIALEGGAASAGGAARASSSSVGRDALPPSHGKRAGVRAASNEGREVIGLAALAAVMIALAPGAWAIRVAQARTYRESLPEVRRALARAGVSSGIVLVASGESLAGALSPDDRERGIVYARSETLLPLLRALYPRLDVYRVQSNERVDRVTSRVVPRLHYPLAWSWPALVRPTRAAVVPAERQRLIVHQAELGATVTIPIWVPRDGRYHVALHGVSTSVSGRWLPRIGGHAGPVFDGYGDRVAAVSVVWPRTVELARGYRRLELSSVGRDARSGGLLAAFETLDLERESARER